MAPTFRRVVPLRALALLLSPSLIVPAAAAREGDWYVGAGASAAFLRPDADVTGFEPDEDVVAGGTLFFGRDLDDRSSAQLQLHGLGEGGFESGESVDYLGAEAAVLYRFLDTRDRRRRLGAIDGRTDDALGVSLHGRFGLGFLDRDSDVELENEGGVYFGAGLGAELHVTSALAFRAEGIYHDTDAASLSLSLVARFGQGRRGRLPPAPLPEPSAAPQPSAPPTPSATPPLPVSEPDAAEAPAGPTSASGSNGVSDGAGSVPDATIEQPDIAPPLPTPNDEDGDGVADATDVCPRSTPGFPVRDNGCALLDGVLSNVVFAEGTAELLPGAFDQLDALANLLANYPEARIELLAHTDDAGSVRDQSILTRARLRTVGLYLVQQRGVSANRIVLRSFGGTRPLYDNATPGNRRLNNRIEVVENTD